MKLHDGCPIVEDVFNQDPNAHREPYQNGLFVQVAQGLSAQFVSAVSGTRAGLTDERIEAIRQAEIRKWGNIDDPEGEATYLDKFPALAKAVHDCELCIQLGKCTIN